METLNRILTLLSDKGYKQKELTDYLGLGKTTFTQWKQGNNQSYLKYIAQIANFLGVSTDYLLTGEAGQKTISPETEQTVSSGKKKKAPLVWGYDDDSVSWTHINTKKDKKNLSDSQTIDPQSKVDVELFKLIQQLPDSEKYKLIGRIQATLDLLK